MVIDRLIADIDAARHHVHLLFYIFKDDSVGRRVAEALARAAQRGVACRVLADAVGSRQLFRRLAPWLRQQGVRIFCRCCRPRSGDCLSPGSTCATIASWR